MYFSKKKFKIVIKPKIGCGSKARHAFKPKHLSYQR